MKARAGNEWILGRGIFMIVLKHKESVTILENVSCILYKYQCLTRDASCKKLIISTLIWIIIRVAEYSLHANFWTSFNF